MHQTTPCLDLIVRRMTSKRGQGGLIVVQRMTSKRGQGESVHKSAQSLQSCTKVAVDFVSPENIHECIRLTEEFRMLPRNHRVREDKLEIKKMILHGMNQAMNELQRLKSSSS